MDEENGKLKLPENAFRKLKPGEKYIPVVKDNRGWKQISWYSFFIGTILMVLLSGASAFLGVKIAQVPEAAMSAALIAVVIGIILNRQRVLLENVMIQSIASVATGVGAGALFVIPALYILELEMAGFWATYIMCGAGALIGLIFTIIVRKYYCVDTHGEYTYPEGKVIAQTLMLSEGGAKGDEVKLVLTGLGFGGVVDTLLNYLGLWKESFSTAFIPIYEKTASAGKLVFNYGTSAAMVGMGYIVGLRFALMICGATAFGYWVLVPIFGHLHEFLVPILPNYLAIKDPSVMSAEGIFVTYIRPIGIGTFFAAGVIGLILQGKVIVKSIGESFRGMQTGAVGIVPESERNLKFALVMAVLAITLVATIVFSYFGLLNQQGLLTVLIIVATIIVLIVFMPAAIMATITMGNAPVSGMTLVCLVLSCTILAASGFTGANGMLVAVLFGTFMCTALAFSSSFITDMKVGHWIGATPAKQQGMKIFMALLSVAVVIVSMNIINETYGFVKSDVHPYPVPAPQANAMAAVIKLFLGGEAAPWWLYGFGAFLAVVSRFVFGWSAIAIALGLYIPMDYNMPMLGGALIAYFVSKKWKNETDNTLAQDRERRGMMIATGFIAAGSIAGILAATLLYFNIDLSHYIFTNWLNLWPIDEAGKLINLVDDPNARSTLSMYSWSNYISLFVMAISTWFLYRMARGKKA